MHFPSSLTVALLAHALGAAAVPAALSPPTSPLEPRADCVVNAAYNNNWYSSGLDRYRTYFSSWNTPTDAFCGIFINESYEWGATNCACWEERGVSWMADCSYVRGPAGQSQYDNHRIIALRKWIDQTKCRTG
ncbi:hypothetical protein DE146DRAFT_634992 [Phaeosphaeria sp. MPI-PUGE-AT-0046c]|nr:hypothetical protein DE146DRAFT_634992 [Phaeosphaeria sp. MPI-PUGE-AT-0046c]